MPKHCSFPVHMIPPLQKQEHRNPVRQKLLRFRWWSQSPKCACRACGTTSTRLSKDPGRPTQAPAGSARPLHASHTCSGYPRSTRGTGRAVREVPSIQQVPLLSMSRDLTTHKRARPTVDWARETFARRTRALQTRGQHAAPVAPLERRKALGRRFAGRTAAAHFTRNGSDCCRNRRRPHVLSASHVRVH